MKGPHTESTSGQNKVDSLINDLYGNEKITQGHTAASVWSRPSQHWQTVPTESGKCPESEGVFSGLGKNKFLLLDSQCLSAMKWKMPPTLCSNKDGINPPVSLLFLLLSHPFLPLLHLIFSFPLSSPVLLPFVAFILSPLCGTSLPLLVLFVSHSFFGTCLPVWVSGGGFPTVSVHLCTHTACNWKKVSLCVCVCRPRCTHKGHVTGCRWSPHASVTVFWSRPTSVVYL